MKGKPQRAVSAILLLGMLFLVIAFHNDALNRGMLKKTSFYTNLESFAHALDVQGLIMEVFNPVSDSNKINIYMEDAIKDTLQVYAKCRSKAWLPIQIEVEQKRYNAKLKLYGTHYNHYLNGNFSYRIKMAAEGPWKEGMRVFNLIKWQEADPTIIAANALAKEWSLIASGGKMVMLSINDEENGAYCMVEHFSPTFMEREFAIDSFAVLKNVNDWTRKENTLYGGMHISDLDWYVGHIKADNNELHPAALGHYQNLCALLATDNVLELVSHFDINYMAKFFTLLALFNDIHHISGDNLELVYDFRRAKFFPIYRQESGSISIECSENHETTFNTFPNFNKLVFERSMPGYNVGDNAKLFKLLLSHDKIRHLRDVYLQKFINEKELYTAKIDSVMAASKTVMLASDKSRKAQYFDEQQQLNVLNATYEFGKEYLEYGHIYGSFNRKENKLNLAVDAFGKIKIDHVSPLFKEVEIVGIGLSTDLNLVHRFTELIMDSDSFPLAGLVFTNLITNNRIEDAKIHINQLETPSGN